ncbi:DUF3805 domain-containing protein [Hymenobacter koreensis]|uniref:DUF3805 domain-containing protein n=1 Tax=Hymenobacter koreensis TaxID=1084523 RepID=UPI003CD056A9
MAMPTNKSRRFVAWTLTGLLASCSLNSQNTQSYTSPNGWFTLEHPISWQLELEAGVYTFVDPNDLSWAFQVSAY